MALPQNMRCIEMAGPGGPENLSLSRAPLPVLQAGELLVRVQAAGVNRPDIAQRKGLYPPPPDASPVLGLEVAGAVAALGEGVTGFAVGDRVCALANGGGYADYCAVPAGQCLPWPHGFTAVQAAALPENFFTVWANVFHIGRLAAGETLLVHGGSSGIGTTAIQLAKARGALVYATAGSAEKCAACVRLGATAAINYKEEDFAERIQSLTQGRGVDVILDIIGAAYFARNLASLAMDGRLVEISVQQGAVAEQFNLAELMKRRLTVTGSTLRPRNREQKAAIATALRREVWPLLEDGRVAPQIYRVFPLEQVADAHRLMESSQHIGKIMLDMTA